MSQSYKPRSLSEVPDNLRNEDELRQFLDDVRRLLLATRRGDVATSVGVVTVGGGAGGGSGGVAPPPSGGTYVPDYTPPPTPSGVQVFGGLTTVSIKTDDPTFTQGNGYARTIVWGMKYVAGDPPPTFSSAVIVHEFVGSVGSFSTEPATEWHLWLKWRTRDGIDSVSPSGGAGGHVVVTGQDPSKLLEALNGQITASQLFAALAARIDLVDGAAGLAGSVNNRLQTQLQAQLDAIEEAGPNLLPDGGFDVDFDSNGVANGWTEFVGGSGDGARVTTKGLIAPLLGGAGKAQRLQIDAQGNANDSGLHSASFDLSPSTTYTLHGYIRSNTSGLYAMLREYDQTDSISYADNITPAAPAGQVAPVSVTFTTHSLTRRARVLVRGLIGVGNWLQVDDMALRRGTVVTPWAAAASDGAATASAVEQVRVLTADATSGNLALATRASNLEATVNTAGTGLTARVLTLSTAVSDLQSNKAEASVVTQIQSSLVSRPNLIPNAGFAIGSAGWNTNGQPFVVVQGGGWGASMQAFSLSSSSGTVEHSAVSAFPGRWYTVHGDAMLSAAAGQVGFDVVFLNSALQLIGDGGQSLRSAPFDFSENDETRNATAVEALAPAGTAYAVARFLWVGVVGLTAIGFRQMKLEQGGLPHTGYSEEAQAVELGASVTTHSSAITDLQNNKAEASSLAAVNARMNSGGDTYSAIVAAQQTATAANDNANGRATAQSVTDLQARVDSPTIGNNPTYAALQAEASVRADQTGYLGAQYNVRADLNGFVIGYGFSGTSAPGVGTTSAFMVRTDQFSVVAPTQYTQETAPAGASVDQRWYQPSTRITRRWTGSAWEAFNYLPFVVQASPTTVNGQSVPAGVYMSAAYITDLTVLHARIAQLIADQIVTADLSATKLTAGDGTIGGRLKSSNYVPGLSGWQVNPDGTSYFMNVVVGNSVSTAMIYAGAGMIGGFTINAHDLRSNNYVPGTTGLRLNDNGSVECYSLTASGNIEATRLNAASGTLGTITAGLLRNTGDTFRIDLNATGSQIQMRSGTLVNYGLRHGFHYESELQANGRFYLSRGYVGNPMPLAGNDNYTIPLADRPCFYAGDFSYLFPSGENQSPGE